MRRYPPARKPDWGGRKIGHLRRAIYARDRGICQECGQFVTFQEFQLDHIIARANGGTDDTANLRVTCQPCNRSKSDH